MTIAAYHQHMAATQRLISIRILFIAGCDLQSLPKPRSKSIAQRQTTTQQSEVTVKLETLPVASIVTVDPPNEITGKVVGIIDGDTIDILTAEKTKIRIRLNGMDAPEEEQPFSKNAKLFLSEFIGGQGVRVVTHGEDRHQKAGFKHERKLNKRC